MENNFYNNGQWVQNGPQAQEKFMNVLTSEQIKQLQQKQQQFHLGITQEEMLRAICNHRSEDGTRDTLMFDDETGIATCTTCGYSFRPIDSATSIDQIRDEVDNIVDILQTIKMLYIDLPPKAATDFFPIIALLGKVPQLFEFAAKNMSKHENMNWRFQNQNMGAASMFMNLPNMFAGGFGMGQPQQGAPMGGYGWQQPQQAPMGGGVPPMPNPAYSSGGYVGTATPNPFTGAPVGAQPGAGYQAQSAGFQFNAVGGQQSAQPQQAAPQGAAPAPAPQPEVTVKETVQA